MKPTSKCRKKSQVVGDRSFNVELCGCGAIHVNIGYTTLRLEPAAYRQLACAINQGLRALPAAPTTEMLH